jgi:hypothetical protein
MATNEAGSEGGTDVADSGSPGDVVDVPVSNDGGPSRAGLTCMTTADCANSNLMCDTMSIAGGACYSMTCMEGTVAVEQASCGGMGSTCLTADIGGMHQQSQCTRSCHPGTATACRPGQVCTTYWFTQEPMGHADNPGCVSFCTQDSDCPSGTHCNTRSGNCTGPGTGTHPDGTPCTPPAMGMPETFCRGLCFQVDTTATHGICGSFINAQRTSACPDQPTNGQMINPLHPMTDDLAICIFATCNCDADCPTGIVCLTLPNLGNICTFPDPMGTEVTMCPSDGGVESGTDAASDAGTDAPVEAGSDAGVDAHTDAGDAG